MDKFVTLNGDVLDTAAIRELVFGAAGHTPVDGQMDLLNDPVENPNAAVFVGEFKGYDADGDRIVRFFGKPKSCNELV